MKKDLCQYVCKGGRCTHPAQWVYGPTDKGKYIKVCTQHRNKLAPEKETFESAIASFKAMCAELRHTIETMKRCQMITPSSSRAFDIDIETKRLHKLRDTLYKIQVYYKEHFKK